MALTNEQTQKYMENRGMNCPVCETDNIETIGHDFEDNAAYLYCHCNECGEFWTDEYKLVGVVLEDDDEEVL